MSDDLVVPGDAAGQRSDRHRSTGRKIGRSIAALAAWAVVVGTGTFGTFTDPATPFSEIRDDAGPGAPR